MCSSDLKAAVLQVRQEAAFGLVVGVGNMVAAHRLFPGYFAFTCHSRLLENSQNLEKR